MKTGSFQSLISFGNLILYRSGLKVQVLIEGKKPKNSNRISISMDIFYCKGELISFFSSVFFWMFLRKILQATI